MEVKTEGTSDPVGPSNLVVPSDQLIQNISSSLPTGLTGLTGPPANTGEEKGEGGEGEGGEGEGGEGEGGLSVEVIGVADNDDDKTDDKKIIIEDTEGTYGNGHKDIANVIINFICNNLHKIDDIDCLKLDGENFVGKIINTIITELDISNDDNKELIKEIINEYKIPDEIKKGDDGATKEKKSYFSQFTSLGSKLFNRDEKISSEDESERTPINPGTPPQGKQQTMLIGGAEDPSIKSAKEELLKSSDIIQDSILELVIKEFNDDNNKTYFERIIRGLVYSLIKMHNTPLKHPLKGIILNDCYGIILKQFYINLVNDYHDNSNYGTNLSIIHHILEKKEEMIGGGPNDAGGGPGPPRTQNPTATNLSDATPTSSIFDNFSSGVAAAATSAAAATTAVGTNIVDSTAKIANDVTGTAVKGIQDTTSIVTGTAVAGANAVTAGIANAASPFATLYTVENPNIDAILGVIANISTNDTPTIDAALSPGPALAAPGPDPYPALAPVTVTPTIISPVPDVYDKFKPVIKEVKTKLIESITKPDGEKKLLTPVIDTVVQKMLSIGEEYFHINKKKKITAIFENRINELFTVSLSTTKGGAGDAAPGGAALGPTAELMNRFTTLIAPTGPQTQQIPDVNKIKQKIIKMIKKSYKKKAKYLQKELKKILLSDPFDLTDIKDSILEKIKAEFSDDANKKTLFQHIFHPIIKDFLSNKDNSIVGFVESTYRTVKHNSKELKEGNIYFIQYNYTPPKIVGKCKEPPPLVNTTPVTRQVFVKFLGMKNKLFNNPFSASNTGNPKDDAVKIIRFQNLSVANTDSTKIGDDIRKTRRNIASDLITFKNLSDFIVLESFQPNEVYSLELITQYEPLGSIVELTTEDDHKFYGIVTRMKNGSRIIQVYISPEDLTNEGVIKDIKEYGLNTARGKPNIYEYDESINPEKRFKTIVDLFSYAAYYEDIINPVTLLPSAMVGGGNKFTFKQFMPMTDIVLKEIMQKVLTKDPKNPSIELLMVKLGPLYREYFQQKMFGREMVLVFTMEGKDVYLKEEHFYKEDDSSKVILMDEKYFTTNDTEINDYKSNAATAAINTATTAAQKRAAINTATAQERAAINNNIDMKYIEGFSEPRSGIVGAPSELNLENPRSSIDVTKQSSVKSTEDERKQNVKLIKYLDKKYKEYEQKTKVDSDKTYEELETDKMQSMVLERGSDKYFDLIEKYIPQQTGQPDFNYNYFEQPVTRNYPNVTFTNPTEYPNIGGTKRRNKKHKRKTVRKCRKTNRS
jgi:hypothetical protein